MHPVVLLFFRRGRGLKSVGPALVAVEVLTPPRSWAHVAAMGCSGSAASSSGRRAKGGGAASAPGDPSGGGDGGGAAAATEPSEVIHAISASGLDKELKENKNGSATAAPPGGAGAEEWPAPRNDWFSKLFGFSETNYAEAKRWLQLVSADEERNRGPGRPDELLSLPNGARFVVGRFGTPSLAELRAHGRAAGDSLRGRLRVSNELGDVAGKHEASENRLATFQVASQFNCLEMVDPHVVPENGVTQYETDRTQGPACAIACGAATVFRNYFVPIRGEEGQTSDRQIDNLADISNVIGNVPAGTLFQVRNGYMMANEQQLLALNRGLQELSAAGGVDEVRAALRVGLQDDAQVTSSNWGKNLVKDAEQRVTQVFGSALPVSYNSNTLSASWEPFARLVLEACYEATLWAAVLAARRHQGAHGSKRVFLTAIGGGAFGNETDWIIQAMQRALELFRDYDLDVRIVSYTGPVDAGLRKLEEQFGR